MSNSAKAVLWMGLFLILVGIIRNWSSLKGTLLTGSAPVVKASGGGTPTVGNTGIGNCPTGYNYIPGAGCVKLSKGQPQCPQGYVFFNGQCLQPLG